MFTSCGRVKTLDHKTDNGKVVSTTYDTYGLFNSNNKKNPDVRYELIVGNVVWSIILIETLVAPIYFIGFSLFEPISMKSDKFNPGEI